MHPPIRRQRRRRRRTGRTESSTQPSVLLLHNLDPSWGPADRAEALAAVEELERGLEAEGHPVVVVAVEGADLARILAPYDPKDYVVFNWCEELPGVPRSDSVAARTLEDLGFVYTGSPPGVLELAWDKVAVKKLLRKHRIATPHFQVCTAPKAKGWSRYPAIVKPAFEHCSAGIGPDAVVLDAAELEERVARVLELFAQPVIVEDFIDGRELHVTVWGNGVVEALPAAEMDFAAYDDLKRRLCCYDSKFSPGSGPFELIEMKVPATLEPGEIRRLERTCFRAYRAMGCRDFARLDLRMREGVFYVLDINPNADLSPDTSLRYSAEHAGWSYGAVGSRLVRFAAERHPYLGCLDAANV